MTEEKIKSSAQSAVLIIDDEENMRHMLSSMLKRDGYSVDTAMDGEEGLAKLVAGAFDYVLCDIRMPKMDGMAFLPAAKASASEATIIMMSAYGTIDLAVEAMKLERKYGIEVVSFVLKETSFGDKLVETTEEKKRRELIAEAENYAADQEASRIRKLYAAYVDGIQALQKSVGREDGSTDNAILQFLTQQKWATAYEKNQEGQNTVVIQNTEGSPGLTLPTPAMKPVTRRQPGEQ